MDINIGDYKITSDPMNVILKKKYEKIKDGEPSGEYDFKTIGFYKNLEAACMSLMDRDIMSSDAENIGELAEYISVLKRDIVKAIGGGSRA